MPAPPSFDYSYISFTSAAEPFVRADDVGFAVSEFMWFEGRPFYPIGALANANIARVRLSAGLHDERDEDNLDLIFQMREVDGGSFFEIVLRSHQGTTYGGWAWGRDLVVLQEIVEGHRVLATSHLEGRLRFIYCPRLRRYKTEEPAVVSKIALGKANCLQIRNDHAASLPPKDCRDRSL